MRGDGKKLVVYVNCAGNSDRRQTRYDQPIIHLNGEVDDAIRLGCLSHCGCFLPAASLTPLALAPPPDPTRDPKANSHKTRTETLRWLHPKARMRAVRLGIRASLAGAWRAAPPDDLHPRATATC